MGDVRPLLRASGDPRVSCEVGQQQLQTGSSDGMRGGRNSLLLFYFVCFFVTRRRRRWRRRTKMVRTMRPGRAQSRVYVHMFAYELLEPFDEPHGRQS